jgi:putative PIN family toxin of toxin-antitoxin system
LPSPQRAVIDTNTWISGLIWQGAPRVLVQRVIDGQLRAVTSEQLVNEFERVLLYPRIAKVLGARSLESRKLAEQLRLLCDTIAAPPLPTAVSRDPQDDAVLACAVSGHADFIVSGDQDLLVLGEYAGIPILSVSQALAALLN